MDDLNAVTLELLRMFSGRAFHNSGPDFANATNTLTITLASARAIIRVSGHQHQWFPGVSQVVTM